MKHLQQLLELAQPGYDAAWIEFVQLTSPM